MPWSGDLLDDKAKQFFEFIKPEVNSILDVGVGAGKYGKIWKSMHPPVNMQGVEIETDFFTRFAAVYNEYYNSLYNENIMKWMNRPELKYDLIIFGDVLEHLPKSQGLDILNFFVYRCKYMWIQYPQHYIQNPSDIEGYFHEAHISVWRPEDFDTLDTNYHVFYKQPLVAIALQGYIVSRGLGEYDRYS